VRGEGADPVVDVVVGDREVDAEEAAPRVLVRGQVAAAGEGARLDRVIGLSSGQGGAAGPGEDLEIFEAVLKVRISGELAGGWAVAVELGEGVEVVDAGAAEGARARRGDADELEPALTRALGEAMRGVGAVVALVVELEGELLEGLGERSVEGAPDGEQLLEVVGDRAELGEGGGALDRLAAAGLFVNTDDDGLDVVGVEAVAGDDQRGLGEAGGDEAAVEGDLDAVIGAIAAAGLALDEAQDGARVAPEEQDEVDLAA
jgi:hypothetical protein